MLSHIPFQPNSTVIVSTYTHFLSYYFSSRLIVSTSVSHYNSETHLALLWSSWWRSDLGYWFERSWVGFPRSSETTRSLKFCSRSARSLWKMRWYFPYSPFFKPAIVQNSTYKLFRYSEFFCWTYHLPTNPSKHMLPLFANRPSFYIFNLIRVARTTYLDLNKLLFGFIVGFSRTPRF